jgi:ribosomal protein S12 methylthiotransferase
MKKKSVAIISLGCFRNTYDSGKVLRDFPAKEYILKKDPQSTDTLLLNTCAFITAAKKESIEAIRAACRLKRTGAIKKLIVLGCLVQRYPQQLKKTFPEVDVWRGVSEKIENRKEKREEERRDQGVLKPGHIGFLKICEGCLNRCSYCAIPLIKGPLRSRLAASLIKEARELSHAGVKELNIIGQDITSWGKDLGGRQDLCFLLKEILKNTNIPWIRLLYLHPRHVSDELLELIASQDRICKYIDLPIQHIDDRILKAMNRGDSRKRIESLIEKIRDKIPGCVIRTSVIVGFPSETKKEFCRLKDFLKITRFERLGAFEYSREEGTLAYKMSAQVRPRVISSRFRVVMKQQEALAQDINRRFLGKYLDVLVDENDDGCAISRSRFEAYDVDGVIYLAGRHFKPGNFYRVKITGIQGHDLLGE